MTTQVRQADVRPTLTTVTMEMTAMEAVVGDDMGGQGRGRGTKMERSVTDEWKMRC